MDILSATILECLNTTLYSVLQLSATLIEAPQNYFIINPQEVNYLAGKEAPSSALINYLWRYNYSEYSSWENFLTLTANQF